jgi:hypothetical protein
MNRSHITYAPCPEATALAEVSALAAIYKLCLERSHAHRNAVGVTSTKGDDATVKSGKEVTHVDQRPG